MSRKIKKVTIIGLGVLGMQIAAHSSDCGFEVTVYDPLEGAFERAADIISKMDPAMVQRPGVNLEAWPKAFAKVKRAPSLAEAVAGADLVIEAVPENLEIKLQVWKEIDAAAPAEAILATNSSSLPISRVSAGNSHPERCLNLHFYMIYAGQTMADVMGTEQTTEEVFETGRAFIKALGMAPLTVKKELMGFCFNRIWRAIKKETLYMWANDFVDFKDMDRAYMIFNDVKMGPFGLMDAVGLDTVYNIEMAYFQDSQDPKDAPPQKLKDWVDAGKLGVKSGQGFYSYPDPEYKEDDFLMPK